MTGLSCLSAILCGGSAAKTCCKLCRGSGSSGRSGEDAKAEFACISGSGMVEPGERACPYSPLPSLSRARLLPLYSAMVCAEALMGALPCHRGGLEASARFKECSASGLYRDWRAGHLRPRLVSAAAWGNRDVQNSPCAEVWGWTLYHS